MIRPNMNPGRPSSFTTILVIIMLIAACVVAMRDKFPEWFSKKPAINEDCVTEKQRTFRGTVKQAYYDSSSNEKTFVIDFTNGYKYSTPAFLKSLDGEIEPGDSVVKEAGAFKFDIYKPGASMPVSHVENVDCDN